MNVPALDAAPTTGRPFSLDDDAAYRAWRDWKLARAPRSAEDLIVEVGDPGNLTRAELTELVTRCRDANMAVYASRGAGGKDVARELGRQLGLTRLDANWLADEDGISSLQAATGGTQRQYIPYTDLPIRWHTDGYYHPPSRRIRAMLLHCVERADAGGENRLMDHEIAYILLRDRNPQHVRALMAHDAMTVPARVEDGRIERPAQPGPVFSIDAGGFLHMRYTARAVSIEWKNDAATRAALAALEDILGTPCPWMFRGRLEPGMGLVSNNVLHTRTPFTDSARHQRLIYRARYYQRVGAG